ncbi:hypothetical protein WN51_00216 [Melipona quadrifasciata]|uniref:Uncharacterized protein n=1 Tax=Melipona quadrifasciata TaxID=166423 RepID=A0A0N0U7V0_9HYME|nr:hypothetical protein WN51_00216 [Melipona quadrifasciata]
MHHSGGAGYGTGPQERVHQAPRTTGQPDKCPYETYQAQIPDCCAAAAAVQDPYPRPPSGYDGRCYDECHRRTPYQEDTYPQVYNLLFPLDRNFNLPPEKTRYSTNDSFVDELCEKVLAQVGKLSKIFQVSLYTHQNRFLSRSKIFKREGITILPPFFRNTTQLLAEVLLATANIRIFVTVNNIRGHCLDDSILWAGTDVEMHGEIWATDSVDVPQSFHRPQSRLGYEERPQSRVGYTSDSRCASGLGYDDTGGGYLDQSDPRMYCTSGYCMGDTMMAASRGVCGEEVELDMRRHIQACACTCNHMGYGNYMDYQIPKDLKRIKLQLVLGHSDIPTNQKVQKESDELFYTVWSLVMVRNQLPAQVVNEAFTSLLRQQFISVLLFTIQQQSQPPIETTTENNTTSCKLDHFLLRFLTDPELIPINSKSLSNTKQHDVFWGNEFYLERENDPNHLPISEIVRKLLALNVSCAFDFAGKRQTIKPAKFIDVEDTFSKEADSKEVFARACAQINIKLWIIYTLSNVRKSEKFRNLRNNCPFMDFCRDLYLCGHDWRNIDLHYCESTLLLSDHCYKPANELKKKKGKSGKEMGVQYLLSKLKVADHDRNIIIQQMLQ